MKSKVKVKKDEKLGRTFIDYYKCKDKDDFRFKTLKALCKEEKLFVLINTNLCCTVDNSVPRDNIKAIEQYVKDKGFRNTVMPIENTNRKSVFGFLTGNKGDKNPSYKLGFILPEGAFTKEIFDSLFSIYDIEIGLGFVKEEDDIFEDFRKGYIDSFFDKDYFSNAIFGAIMFEKMITDLEVDESAIISLTPSN